jgi:L-alanine-DL-glutamate epimerase-like enolase superfamily enzyme
VPRKQCSVTPRFCWRFHVGEFIFSPYNFPAYIMAEALAVVHFIAHNIGGIAGGMKVGHLGECFGTQCAPHNRGNVFDLAGV